MSLRDHLTDLRDRRYVEERLPAEADRLLYEAEHGGRDRVAGGA
ncbi:hypothetical protein NUM3379_36470 [Kineococcus sp. NUM-3379]